MDIHNLTDYKTVWKIFDWNKDELTNKYVPFGIDNYGNLICFDAEFLNLTATRITLVPEKMLDKYRELEKATGFKMKDIGFNEQSLAFYRFMDGDIQDIPHFDNGFVKSVCLKILTLLS